MTQLNSGGSSRLKYLAVLVLLVASSVVAIAGSVSLSHWITASYADAIDTNRQWALRLEQMAELEDLANAIDTPGNDVFASGNAKLELDRQKTAYRDFNERQGLLRENILKNIPPSQDAMVRQTLREAITRIEQVNAEGELTLHTFAAGDSKGAGEHMAAMDQAMGAFSLGINSLESSARKLHQENFDAQSRKADLARTIGRLIGVGFALLVVWLGYYGLRLYRMTNAVADERERAIRLAQEREAHLGAIVSGACDGIVSIDERGIVQSLNPAGERMFGYSPSEVVGRNFSMLMAAPDGDNPGNISSERLSEMAGRCQELLGKRKTGETFPLEFTISTVPVASGRKFVGLLRDITDRKRTEEVLASARDAAHAANRAKSEFLANMSHEIRTPISAIVGFSDMMLFPDQTQSDRFDGLQTIRRNAQHLLGLINDILDISKIEAGKMTVERIDCDLPLLLGEVMSMLQPRALEKDLRIQLTLDTPVPRTIRTDPLRLRQVLVNLLGNAIKFTPSGQVHVRIAHPDAEGPLYFSVVDSGIGMTGEQLSRLFQPFTQADGSTTRRFGGSGLGLTISKRLAELLGGDVVALSEVGKGSTFRVWIDPGTVSGPYVDSIEDTVLQPATALTEAGIDNIKLQGRVLLAEDGIDNQRFISAMLRRAGAEVVIADNGRIAFDLALSQTFDVVFMDMQMPVLDGYAATSKLRSRGFLTPIVALTAHAMAEDRAKCIQAGCTDYLTKPIDRVKLVKTAAKYIAITGRASAEAVAATGIGSAQGALSTGAPAAPTLTSTFADDPVMKDILVEFVASLPVQAAQIRQFIAEDRGAELRDVVHQMKGAGGTYGFDSITALAGGVEARLKAGEAIQAIHDDVESLLQLLRTVHGYDPAVEASWDEELAHAETTHH